jgi:hypothetical protein
LADGTRPWELVGDDLDSAIDAQKRKQAYFEVRGAHYRRGYDGELLRILVAEIIEAVHRAKMMDVFRRHGMTPAAPPPVK